MKQQLDFVQSEYSHYQASTQSMVHDLTLRLQSASKLEAKTDAQQQELKCLADNIYYEAATEPYEGRLAVATVTINRMHNRNFPKTICGVVYQKSETACAFSWTCGGALAKTVPSLYNESRKIAARALLMGDKSTEVQDALYFHTQAVDTGTNQSNLITQIGNHLFFRDLKETQ